MDEQPAPGVDRRFLPSTGTPDGQIIRFAAGLSGLSGRRRRMARVLALVWLTAIALSVVVPVLSWLAAG